MDKMVAELTPLQEGEQIAFYDGSVFDIFSVSNFHLLCDSKEDKLYLAACGELLFLYAMELQICFSSFAFDVDNIFCGINPGKCDG